MMKKVLPYFLALGSLLCSTSASADYLTWSPDWTITSVKVQSDKVTFNIAPYDDEIPRTDDQGIVLEGCDGRLSVWPSNTGLNYHHVVGALLSAYSNNKTIAVLYNADRSSCGHFHLIEFESK